MEKEPEEAAQSHGASPQGGTGLPAPAPRSGSQVWRQPKAREGAGPHLNLVTPWPNPARFQVQGSHLLLMAAPSREPWPLPWVPVHVWQGLSAGGGELRPRALQAHARPESQTSGLFKGREHNRGSGRRPGGPSKRAAQPQAHSRGRTRQPGRGPGRRPDRGSGGDGPSVQLGHTRGKWRAQGRPCPSLLLRPHVSASSLQSLEHSTGPVPSASCTVREGHRTAEETFSSHE